MFLEMRTYVLKPGMTNNFVERFAAGLPARLADFQVAGIVLFGGRRAQPRDPRVAL